MDTYARVDQCGEMPSLTLLPSGYGSHYSHIILNKNVIPIILKLLICQGLLNMLFKYVRMSLGIDR